MTIPRYFSDREMDIIERNPEYNARKNVCPVCGNSGAYTYKGEERVCADDDYGHVAIRLNKLYYKSFIPLEYQLLLWDEFPHLDAKDEIDGYVETFDRLRFTGFGFTIWGKGLGVGKTWAATHILRELVKQGYDGHFARALAAAEYYALDNKDDREFFTKRITDAEILVLDEVKPALSLAQRDFLEEKLEGVVRARTSMNFPTIVTSNMTMQEFEREYPRVFSLLAAKNQDIELGGKDARKSGVAYETVYDLARKGETRPIT